MVTRHFLIDAIVLIELMRTSPRLACRRGACNPFHEPPIANKGFYRREPNLQPSATQLLELVQQHSVVLFPWSLSASLVMSIFGLYDVQLATQCRHPDCSLIDRTAVAATTGGH